MLLCACYLVCVLVLTRQRAAAVALANEFRTVPVSRARLCICGKELVGKSTLAGSLQCVADGRARPALGRTKGIEIADMVIGGKAFSVWDYAGGYFSSLLSSRFLS